MENKGCPLPVADSETGLRVLKALARRRSLLEALEITHADVGNIFQITLPKFKPAILVGPEFNRYVLVSDRDKFLWCSETDPVTKLLRHGLLVEDGQSHTILRELVEPMLQRHQVNTHVEVMNQYSDRIMTQWVDGATLDMLIEMRRVALLILIGTLFSVDFMADMDRMWQPILDAINYISPGPWVIWPNMPRPGYRRALGEIDAYLYDLIRKRRAKADKPQDLLSHLIAADLDDDLIRDQMLTMLIAGHDTSTAQLSWSLYLLGRHPEAMARTRNEVDDELGGHQPDVESIGRLRYLDQVIKESLRLYPPIHVGNRFAKTTLQAQGYEIPQNTRVMYSIYLSHRNEALWPNADSFIPERFDRSVRHKQPALTYVPFGGGPRNCIGATYAQIEAKVVLARILQSFDLQLVAQDVRPHMGATLEPRPGVMMQVFRRNNPNA